jgi:hypothetical protein
MGSPPGWSHTLSSSFSNCNLATKNLLPFAGHYDTKTYSVNSLISILRQDHLPSLPLLLYTHPTVHGTQYVPLQYSLS